MSEKILRKLPDRLVGALLEDFDDSLLHLESKLDPLNNLGQAYYSRLAGIVMHTGGKDTIKPSNALNEIIIAIVNDKIELDEFVDFIKGRRPFYVDDSNILITKSYYFNRNALFEEKPYKINRSLSFRWHPTPIKLVSLE